MNANPSTRGYAQGGTAYGYSTHGLVKVPLNRGGYDRRGQYFGAVFGHEPIGYLYRLECFGTGTVTYVRAWSRIGARAEAFKLFAGAIIQGNRS